MYTLDGRQKKALHAALLRAFPRHTALARLVEFQLDENLAAIAGEGPLRDVVFHLVEWAESSGRLDALIEGARQENPQNPELIDFERAVIEARDARPADASLRQFAERVRLAPRTDDPDLEKRVFKAGFSDIAQWRARLGEAELTVCRIEAPAWRALGTGFLVGPDLILTNRHVVEPLATQQAPPLVARFDYKVSPDGTRLREGETYGVATDWLVASSPIEALDFAVIRLSAPAGLRSAGGTAGAPARGWLRPAWRDLEADETVFVVQHPLGDALKLAAGRFDRREAARLHYVVDTEPGSSGSPCLSAQLDLVGLHRGSAEGHANQGIPIDAIGGALPPGLLPSEPPPRPTGTPPVNDAHPPTMQESLAVAPVRPRRLQAIVAIGALMALGLATLPLLHSNESPPERVVTPAPPATRTEPPPPRRPVHEVTVAFSSARLDPPQGCSSDATFERRQFRLETRGEWPGDAHGRGREVQIAYLADGGEIEGASIAAGASGSDATAVAVPRRGLARKWVFASAVARPVVIVVCVRAAAGTEPLPAFRINTWKEVTP